MATTARIPGPGFFTAVVVCALLARPPGTARAEEPAARPEPPKPPTLQELLDRIARLEKTVAEQQETIRRLEASLPAQSPQAARVDAGTAPPSDLEKQLAQELAAAGGGETKPTETPSPPATGPVTVVQSGSGKSYVNLSLDALMAAGASTADDVETLQSGGHDPSQNGFTLQNLEAVLEGAVDPYFRGQANIVLQLTPDGETTVELEEVYATTTSLPHNLQVKAGQFFSEFGRLNPTHPHSWDFVDQPLVNGRMFGGDGLRSLGARLSWLMPAPFYSELFLSVQNGHGETLTSFGSVPGESMFGRPIVEQTVGSLADFLYVPRYAASFDLTSNETLLVGASAALGPNGTGSDGRTRIYGIDGFWKWKSPRANRGFPFVKLQAEGMSRAYDAAANATSLAARFEDWGAYAQASWGFRPGWVVGARYDRIAGDVGDVAEDPLHEARWRASAALTWYPTEFSKLRFQYNHDAREFSEDADSLWLQFEFLLGAHAAHKF